MADQTLHITTTLDDAALKEFVAKINNGELTVKEYNKTLRDIKASSKIGSTGLVELKNIQTQVADATAGAQGKMMKSYFQTGEELRRFYKEQRLGDRTMRESTQAVTGFATMLGGSNSGLGQIIGGVTGRFQEAEFAVTGLGIASQQLGGKIAVLGQTLMASAGPIAAVVAAIAGVVWMMNEGTKATEAWNKALKDLEEQNVKTGKITKQQQIDNLTRRINELSQAPLADPSFAAALRGPAAMMQERATLAVQREVEIGKLVEQRAELEKTITTEQEKQAEITDKQVKSRQKMLGIGGSTLLGEDFDAGFARERGQRLAAQSRTANERRRAGGDEFDEAEKKLTQFQGALSSGVQAMAQSITGTLGGALMSVFKNQDTLVAHMVGGFIGAIEQIAAKAMTLQIISWLFPGMGGFGAVSKIFGFAGGGIIPEPVIGAGMKTGSMYSFAERGPERVMPNNGEVISNANAARFGSMSAAGPQVIVLETRVRGNDLTLVQERAGRATRGRLL